MSDALPDAPRQIETYFDRTAAEAWEKLTSDAPVSGIRARVRAGRDDMRTTLLVLPSGRPARPECSMPVAARARLPSRRQARRIRHRHRPVAAACYGRARKAARRCAGCDIPLAATCWTLRLAALTIAWRWTRSSTTHARHARHLESLSRMARSSMLFHLSRRALCPWRSCGAWASSSRAVTSRPPLSRKPREHSASALAGINGITLGRSRSVASGFYISASAGAEAPMKQVGNHLANSRTRASCPLQMRRLMNCHWAACSACRCSRFQLAWRWCLLTGTLNRVMIVELGVPAWLVGLMVSCRCCLRHSAL